jgi:PAS domain S-box-containing protein
MMFRRPCPRKGQAIDNNMTRMPDSHPRNQRMIYRVVIVIWLILLLVVTSLIVVLDLQRAAANFNENFNLHYQQANDRVHVIESILEGFTAMVSVVNDPGRERIRSYAQKILEQYPQIFMFEIVEKVPHDKLAAFTEYYRQTTYPDYRVKGFSYESDRQWQPVGETPYHMPIVFMEPFPEQSREVLGLDLGSNNIFIRALQESERLNRSLSTEPFTLIEGDLAYVIHRPVFWFDKPMPSYSYNSGADCEFAVLVVRADSLLDREPHPQPGMRELLYHPNYSETDPGGHLHLHESPATSRLESIIFPRLHASMTLDSTSQPFVLVAGHQLGWGVISWWKLAVTGLIAIFTFMVMRVYARLYFRNEITRAERYLQISRAIIVGLDRNGDITLINHRGCEIMGYSENELLGKNWFETTVPENIRGRVYSDFLKMIAGELEPMRQYENSIQTRSGETRYIDWSNELEINRKGDIIGTLSSGKDITERKRAEESVQRQQRDMAHMMRLGTMGEMATGMAHELNQPLTALVSYCGTAQALVKALPAPPRQLGEILVRATEQAHRAGDIIRHLREFVSKEERNIETLDLDQVVQGVINFLKWEVQQGGVTIQFLPGGQGRTIKAGKVQIEQVLINLLRNSLEAIVHDHISAGEIVIQTRLSANDMIELTVADNGPGLDASIVDRLFEQFQTSKKTGMGIGLSLSRTIIEAHGGKLWVDKEYRNGALFGFVLPVAG